MTVDQYIGGAEHATMHLIYARFFTKALKDMKFVDFSEPFPKLFNQGMIHGEDGFVMSKSRGNIVDPMEMTSKYGADTLRLFLMSAASPDKDMIWSNDAIDGSFRFVKKVINYFKKVKIGKSNDKIESRINKTIKLVSEDIPSYKYNFAVIKIRELFDAIQQENEISKKDLISFIKLFSLFCPHIAEELWEDLGNKGFVSIAKWPSYDEKKIDEKLEETEKNVEKTVSDINNVLKIIKEKQGKDGEKVYLYVIPNELGNYDSGIMKKRIGKEVIIFAVNDKKKYDPESKAGKAKPGKPGIYIE
jgi:leucyl-tRNA synthetase